MQPPASYQALGDPIYEAFYGLTEQPFAITTDPRFFYLSASHQRAFSEMLNGLRRRESLLMLTGETGSGKTTLCRAVLAALGDRTFSAIILNPYMTGAEVLRIVLRDFGLVSHEELRRGGLATADVPQLLDTLEGFLQSLIPLGSHAVIVLDEAQSLAPAALDQIRLLTGLEHQGKRLVQVVLCGQPGLHQVLEADLLRALKDRITRRVQLTSLPADEIDAYIVHRLGVAGGTDTVHFDRGATQLVATLSGGLPRRINVLCDRALQEGRTEGVNVITAELVQRAADAIAGPPAERAAAIEAAPPAPVERQPWAAPSIVARPAAATPDKTPADAPAADETPAVTTSAAATLAIAAPATFTDPPAPAPEAAPPVQKVVAAPGEAPAAPAVAASISSLEPGAKPASPIPSTPGTPTAPSPMFPSEAVEAAASTADADEARALSFGIERADGRNNARTIGLVIAAAVALVALVYLLWGWSAGTSEAVSLPPAPVAPAVDRGTIPPPMPVPTLEQIDEMFPARRILRPAPRPAPAEEPPLVETPLEAAMPAQPDLPPVSPEFN